MLEHPLWIKYNRRKSLTLSCLSSCTIMFQVLYTIYNVKRRIIFPFTQHSLASSGAITFSAKHFKMDSETNKFCFHSLINWCGLDKSVVANVILQYTVILYQYMQNLLRKVTKYVFFKQSQYMYFWAAKFEELAKIMQFYAKFYNFSKHILNLSYRNLLSSHQ